MAKITWVTQTKLAKDLGVKSQCISNWILRKKIKSKYFPDFDKTLVNPLSLTINELEKREDGKWTIKSK